ncbi:hypothetical protein H1S01_03315 [Heliobacterium chlorum]|uniref:Uncharacterized protein n=1 Tax=Heliobacterium chlorum TaxID=2698 RepID=A0ABR7SYN9_HELCL|nr:hypothetical protein [Heliobacterium chlorum]MBC9783541.1 hypothetical protein [Heliobacterium chlorum]
MDRNLNKALFALRKQGQLIPDSLKEAASFGDIRDKIIAMIDSKDDQGNRMYRYWLSIDNVYPDYCIVEDEQDGKWYRVDYTVDAAGNVTIGQWQEVERVWQLKPGGSAGPAPVTTSLTEGATEQGDFDGLTRLTEAATPMGGNKWRMTVLRPGWNIRLDGSLGDKYYTKQFVTSLAPLLEGAKAYADHQTDREEREKPERSTRDLVGYWSDAKVEPDGRATATLTLLESASWLKAAIAEAEKLNNEKGIVLVGPSIDGYGTTRIGDAEGRRGKIVESAIGLRSVDIVTKPAAGGTVDQLIESAKEDIDLDLKNLTIDQLKASRPDLFAQITQTKEAAAPAGIVGAPVGIAGIDAATLQATISSEVTRIVEAAMAPAKQAAEQMTKARVQMEAEPAIRAKLKESKLPDITQDKLFRLLAAADYAKDGSLDSDKLKEACDKAINEEREYISRLTAAGQITGMGGGGDQPPAGTGFSLDGMFGVTEKPAKQ